ncbi:MAG: 16S rRNA (guanine(527)-N(7))-methyltransferase RsmG [Solirubrobacterales bacterium]
MENRVQGKLKTFIEAVLDENQRQNLVSRNTTPEDLWLHVEDCIKAVPLIPPVGTRIADLGSGGGFPAVVLAVALPECEICAIDSDLKKTDFVRTAASALGLPNLQVVRERLEVLGHQKGYRESFDCVTVRAVAGLSTCLEWGFPFLRVNGMMIAWKGPAVETEITEAQNAIQVLGGLLNGIEKYMLQEKERYLVSIRKNSSTSDQYPRKADLAKRRPL